MKILFVCIGNICRSPIAQGVMKYKCVEQNLQWKIDSAGTHNYHVGEPPHESSQLVCKKNGVDISMQQARQFSQKDFQNFNVIYALATDVYQSLISLCKNENEKNKIVLLLDELYEQKGKSVKDPWYGTYSDYEDVFSEISLACDALIKKKKSSK